MNIILIVGPPAVGKFTIGKKLAEQLDYAFIHEHSLLDTIHELGIKKSKKRLSAYFSLFLYTLSLALKTSEKEGLVFTMVFDFSNSFFSQFLSQLLSKFSVHKGIFFFVELSAPLDLRINRNSNPDRLFHKPSKRAISQTSQKMITLDKYCVFESDKIIVKDNFMHLKFDTSKKTIEEAVKSISDSIL